MVSIRTPWIFQDLVEELDKMTREMDWAFGGTAACLEPDSSGLQVREDEAELLLDLPGVRDEDLEIVLEDHLLRVNARRNDLHAEREEVSLRERTFGEFSRLYRLPWRVQEDEVEAQLDRGVLRLLLKRSPEAAPRQIRVKSI